MRGRARAWLATTAVAAALAAGCGAGDGRSAVGPATGARGTTGGTDTCATLVARATPAGEPLAGPGSVQAGTTATLAMVDVQTSWCADAVVFGFGNAAVPAWHVSWRGPTLVVALDRTDEVVLPDPSGPVRIGPGDELRLDPVAPSSVASVRREPPDGTTERWAVELREQRPVAVTLAAPLLVVEVVEATPRTAACDHDGVRVSWPPGWYADLSAPAYACRWFGDAPFAAFPATDHLDANVVVERLDGPFPGGQWDADARSVSDHEDVVGGRRVRFVHTVAGPLSMYPGDHVYVARVEWGDDVVVLVTSGPDGPAFRRHVEAVDWMVERLAVSP